MYFIHVIAYPDNKAQSDDSSSNSKDVGVSSIYHVRKSKIFPQMSINW